MIDIEKLKDGSEIWFLHQNRPASFISEGIRKYISMSGIHFNVMGRDCDLPADHCYFSEMELIDDQLDYWRDMKLMKIVKDNA
jgi:hypothetical protein